MTSASSPSSPSSPSSSRRSFLAGVGASLLVAACERARIDARPLGDVPDLLPAATAEVEAICRSAWGAEPRRASFVRHRVRRLTVHHSGIVLLDNREAPARLRAYQQRHFENGWPDIAYHLMVDRHGNVYRGRPLWARPDTATDYDPRGHLAVMCDGHFGRQGIARAQLAALVQVLAWACARFEVSPRTISGHRDHAATACPGGALYRLIDDGTIRRRVRRRIGSGGTRLVRLCGEAGSERVRLIEAGED